MKKVFFLVLSSIIILSASCSDSVQFTINEFDFKIDASLSSLGSDPYIEFLIEQKDFEVFLDNPDKFNKAEQSHDALDALEIHYNQQFFESNYLFPVIKTNKKGILKTVSINQGVINFTFSVFTGPTIPIIRINTFFVEISKKNEITSCTYEFVYTNQTHYW